MFDIGFSELVVIAVVALVVLGPERLPKVARTAGVLLGRLQRYVNDVKSDINREMQLEELKKLQAEVAESARSIEQNVTKELQTAESSLNQAAQGISEPLSSAAASVEAPVAEAVAVSVAAVEMKPSPAAETPSPKV